jgi:tetratricopeptide (TPR) repeat protein
MTSTPLPLLRLFALLSAALFFWPQLASAQTLKDPALETLYVAEKTDELQKAATQRLAAQADDEQAVLALVLAALQRDDPAARVSALSRAQTCAQKLPRSAPCQYAHGVLLGVQAMNEGMLKAARSASTVREALSAAHEIEPAWFAARSALMEYHLLAPGVMGGSTARAAELARSAPRPEQAQALQGRIALQDKRYEAALAAFASLPAVTEQALAADVRGWSEQAALGLLNSGQATKAQPVFERLMRERPTDAAGAYGLARVRGELGDWAEALRLYELSLGLKGAGDRPIAYRIGIAQQQLGRADAAKLSFNNYLSAGKGSKTTMDDTRKRLSQLGG